MTMETCNTNIFERYYILINTINFILKATQNSEFQKKWQHQPDILNQKEKGEKTGLERGQATVRESRNLDRRQEGLKVSNSNTNGREIGTERQQNLWDL